MLSRYSSSSHSAAFTALLSTGAPPACIGVVPSPACGEDPSLAAAPALAGVAEACGGDLVVVVEFDAVEGGAVRTSSSAILPDVG